MKTIILFIALLSVYTQADSTKVVFDKPVYIGKEPVIIYAPPVWIGDTNARLNLLPPANKALPIN